MNPTPSDYFHRSDFLSLEAQFVPWDAAFFGFPMAQILEIEMRDEIGSTKGWEDFSKWRKANGIKLVSCRLAHEALRESIFLESHEFRFIEMVYPLSFSNLASAVFPETIELAIADKSDQSAIERIAFQAFVTGRFNIDPRLGPELGGKRYAGWVRNSFANDRHEVVKAVVDGEIIGFFINEKTASGFQYWHLTAISPERAGQGLGLRVWQAMLARARRDKITGVRTTISARNTPVVNLYGKLGFRFEPPQMTFHWIDPALKANDP